MNGKGTNVQYGYDDYGNLVSDPYKEITDITYNHLNLPVKITFGGGGKIEYFYDATGVKLKKKVTNGTTITTTDYMDGFQYTNGKLDFFPHAEGYAKAIPSGLGGGTSYTFKYVFSYTDHLGNIRVKYAQNPANGNQIEILEEDHYYPYGLKHNGYNGNHTTWDVTPGGQITLTPVNPFLGDTYKFKFQGQEQQDELGLNWISFKYRNYDPAMGRFFNIDPLTEKYNTWSPYAFSGNRVIDARELEGLEPHSMHSSLDAAATNFAQQYGGLSIRSNLEIGTYFYSYESNGQTVYSYVTPVSGGIVDPYATSDTPSVENASIVGDIHTHGDDPNYLTTDIHSGKEELDGMSTFTVDADYDNADRKKGELPTYQSSYLVGPNGTIRKYTPDGKSTGEDRYKNDKVVSTDKAPRSENSKTKQNDISPNISPEVLPQGIEEDNYPAQ